MAVDVEYVEADLRDVPLEDGPFEAVYNWRTSFGLFDEQGNRKQLHEFARAAARRAFGDGSAQPTATTACGACRRSRRTGSGVQRDSSARSRCSAPPSCV